MYFVVVGLAINYFVVIQPHFFFFSGGSIRAWYRMI